MGHHTSSGKGSSHLLGIQELLKCCYSSCVDAILLDSLLHYCHDVAVYVVVAGLIGVATNVAMLLDPDLLVLASPGCSLLQGWRERRWGRMRG